MIINTPMRLLAAFIIAAVSLAVAQPASGPKLLMRFDNVSLQQLQSSGLATNDPYGPGPLVSFVDDTAWAILTPAGRDSVALKGLAGTTVLEDTSTLRLACRAMYGPTFKLERPYHTFSSLNAEIDSLERAFPGLVHVFTIGHTTAEKLPIRAVKLAKNVGEDDDRPTILFNGCHHSDELLGAEICMRILRAFTAGYGTDRDITRWLTEFQIFVVPVVNVDGYKVVTSGTDPRWRKNRRDTDGDGMMEITDGVDLNRNYDFNWAHGGSGDPTSERYRGRYPFSESENIAVARLARSKHFLASLTYHSFGEVIFYPWTWRGRKAPDDSLLTSMARSVAGSIKTMKGDTCYKAEYGAGTVGQSYTWLYGALGTFDFVVETGWGASFPPAHMVDRVVDANMEGVRTFLRCAEGPGIQVTVRDEQTGTPLQAEVWLPAIETEDVHRRTTRPGSGICHRLLLPGTYQLIISAPGYEPLVLPDVNVGSAGWTRISAGLARQPRP